MFRSDFGTFAIFWNHLYSCISLSNIIILNEIDYDNDKSEFNHVKITFKYALMFDNEIQMIAKITPKHTLI